MLTSDDPARKLIAAKGLHAGARGTALLAATILIVGSLATQGFTRDHAQQVIPGSCLVSGFAQDATYVGSDMCKGCHEETYERVVATSHWREMLSSRASSTEAGCESCHGPGSSHVEGGGDKQKIFTFRPGSAVFCNPCRNCHSVGGPLSFSSPVRSRIPRQH